MKLGRVVKLEREGKTAINDIFSQAQIFKLSAKQVRDKYFTLLDNYRKLKLPRYAISYLNGYYDAQVDFTYQNDLEFGHILDGVIYSTHRESQRNYHKAGISPSALIDCESHHYWKDTDKIWF